MGCCRCWAGRNCAVSTPRAQPGLSDLFHKVPWPLLPSFGHLIICKIEWRWIYYRARIFYGYLLRPPWSVIAVVTCLRPTRRRSTRVVRRNPGPSLWDPWSWCRSARWPPSASSGSPVATTTACHGCRRSVSLHAAAAAGAGRCRRHDGGMC